MKSFIDYVYEAEENKDVHKGVIEYVRIANAALDSDKDSKYFKERDRSFAVKKANKYYKMWVMEWGRESSIHSFIDAETGEVFKPAGLNKPAKGARGNVTDPKWMAQLKTKFDQYGGYLYAR